ncbi:hypothetical protein HG530_011098 [Fusarium avenaceum]|nr:hypothetical protein HG530_011098 [Fusarium avenaceum]
MEWTKATYNDQYKKWVPWLEDTYLRWFTKDNKASYATKQNLDKTKVTGIEQIDNLQDGVNNLAGGQVGQGGLLQPVGDLASKEGINRTERQGKGNDGSYVNKDTPGAGALNSTANAVVGGGKGAAEGLQGVGQGVGNTVGGLLGGSKKQLARLRLVLQYMIIMRVGKVILTRELFKSLTSSLGDEESGENSEKHEEGVDLQNVVHPGGFIGLSSTFSSWEDFAGYDEGGGVGAEVEEKLGKNVNSEETIRGDMILDSLAAEGIDRCYRNPIPRYSARKDDNDVSNSSVMKILVNAEERSVLPLAVVLEEVSEAGLWDLEVGLGTLVNLGASNLIGVTFTLAGHVSLDIFIGLLNVTSDIESITRSFGDLKSNTSWNGTETNKGAPHLINANLAVPGATFCVFSSFE